MKKIWVEKYRPVKVKGLIGNEQLKKTLEKYIIEGEIPSLLFYGPPGTGKTTIAKILIKNLNCEYLYINGSDENGIDVIRNKVGTFGASVAFSDLKIVLCDEADFLTLNAQSPLRNMMEEFSDNTRFIFTCNFPNKIIDALHSRFQMFEIKPPDTEQMLERAKLILKKEQIEYDETDLTDLVQISYPDIRKLINSLQKFSLDGRLQIQKGDILNDSYKSELLKMLKKNDTFENVRKMIINSQGIDYILIYKILFDNVDKYASNNKDNILLDIAEHLYRDSFCVDKEINLSACILKILKHNKEK